MIPAPHALDSKVTTFSKAAALFFLGWLTGGYWHQTRYSDQAAKMLPAIEAKANCEAWRAHKNGNLALSNGFVTKGDLAKDNCPHPEIPKQ